MNNKDTLFTLNALAPQRQNKTWVNTIISLTFKRMFASLKKNYI